MPESEQFTGQHADLTAKIIKVFYSVANELGFGFMEAVYKQSMVVALRQAGLKAEAEVPMPVTFRGHPVGTFYADVVVEGLIILELKTANDITKQHEAQLLHYLRSTPIEIGYALTFGEVPKLRRVILTNDRKPNLGAYTDKRDKCTDKEEPKQRTL